MSKRFISTTAGTLKSILCFIDPENTPKIAYDNDEYAGELIEKIKKCIYDDHDGSQPATIAFDDVTEQELLRQFNGVCKNIGQVFGGLEYLTHE